MHKTHKTIFMKTTLEIPDELYRHVKAKSALEGRPVREVTVALYQNWLRGDENAGIQPGSADRWLEEFLAIGRDAMKDAPPGPTAGEILEEGRNRLEPREA